MFTRIVQAVVPASCWSCRVGVRPDQRLCAACRRDLRWLPADVCPRCALPRAGRHRCPAESMAFDRALAVVVYDGVGAALVRSVKDHGATALLDTMAAQMAAAVRVHAPGPAMVVAVPAHPGRARRRGVDVAAGLAARTAARLGSPYGHGLLRRTDWLTGPQRGTGRAQRLARPTSVSVSAGAVPRAVLLIDDVYTTGATLHAAARALKDAGVQQITAAAWARTLR